MGYDLLNEPWPGSQWSTCAHSRGCPQFETGLLQPFFEHVIDGVREVDADNVVWVEPQIFHTFGSESHLGTLEPIGDEQLGYSWHNYCLPGESVSGEDEAECEFLENRVFELSEEDAERLGAATLLSEWGASDNPNRLERMTRLADEYLVSWQYWDWKEWDDPTGADPGMNALFTNDGDLSSLKQDKADFLSRPYPQATAGTPLELAFDPETADFRYLYQSREASAPTEIYVPVKRHYPNGYEIVASGARVTSAPDAALVTLEETASDEIVEITLTAREAPRDHAPPPEDREIRSEEEPGPRATPSEADGPTTGRRLLPTTGGIPVIGGLALVLLATALTGRRREVSPPAGRP